MDLEQILIFLVVGIVAGWLAGLIIKGGGFGIQLARAACSGAGSSPT